MMAISTLVGVAIHGAWCRPLNQRSGAEARASAARASGMMAISTLVGVAIHGTWCRPLNQRSGAEALASAA